MTLTRRTLGDDDLGAAYRRDGYVVVTDLFPSSLLERARREITALFERRFGVVRNGDALAAHYGDRERWRECARRMADVLPVHGLATQHGIDEVLARLGLEAPIVSTPPEVRTDMPGDEQYMQPWHQDWRYGQGSVNALTIWIPLHDVNRQNGTIELLPRTHLLGYLEPVELSNPRRFSIPDEALPDVSAVRADLRLGEAVVFSQLLVHRSGYNRGGKPRITVQIRYTDAAEPRFVAYGYPRPASSKLLWDEPPTEADARAVYESDAAATKAPRPRH